ncbi:PQQ-binding-like beta-propeller repeat protein [Halorarum halophilum]|uniref:PQQ-binding-like beta-propeller repeat protein n=1 Tax=Halorarum halophilum TaxID=2743090 RepID=A0A7D5GH87_9EURY|nr:PQQ-binding-like beta-propeller repeat protein [Halobaculum halophilum]QLG29030.1 PQQ-binding-like beta-propeller repeat protein [Halobaculum halophilum]
MVSPRDGRQPDSPWTSRRRLLRRAGVGATVGLAGCTSLLSRPTGYDRPQADFDPEVLPYDETYPGDGVTMFRRGLRRLGYYPDAVVPDAVTVDWQRPVNYDDHTAAKASPRPTPDGGTVLIPSDTGRVHAVTPTGEQRWTAETGATRMGIHGTPTIVDGIAFIGGYDGDLYAFDVETGETVWRTRRWALDGSIAIGSSPAYWDGVVYVVAEYSTPDAGTMWAIDAETGRPMWCDDRLLGMPHPSTAIDPVSERLVTGSNDGVVYCWEFPSMEFAWEFQTDGHVKGTTPLYDGSAFVGSWDGNVYRLDLEDGAERWRFETGEVVMSNPGIDPDAGVVYVGGDDHRVHALDADTGEELWARNVGGHVIGSLTVTAESVLVGSYDAHLYALDKGTGTVRWRVRNNGHVTSEAVPHDGRIFYAERAVFSGERDGNDEPVAETPGHAYCLVPDE